MLQCTFLPPPLYEQKEAARRDAVTKRLAELNHNSSDPWPEEVTTLSLALMPPGSMWFCPWYHDPANPDDVQWIPEELAAAEAGKSHLSVHYWRTWAAIRPPICVICPGGRHWVVDQKSNNGDGWTVTGEPPLISCTPSIWVAQGQGPPDEYHGFLTHGVFTVPV